jgi:hypothetical protein
MKQFCYFTLARSQASRTRPDARMGTNPHRIRFDLKYDVAVKIAHQPVAKSNGRLWIVRAVLTALRGSDEGRPKADRTYVRE